MLESSGLAMAAGWLRRRDNAWQSERYIRSRYGIGFRCTTQLQNAHGTEERDIKLRASGDCSTRAGRRKR